MFSNKLEWICSDHSGSSNNRSSGSAGIYHMTGTFWRYDRCLYDPQVLRSQARSAWTDRSGNRRDVHRFCINDCIFHSSGKSWKIFGNDRNCTFCIFHNSGWEYHGEKAFEYLMGTHKFNMIYRIIFSLVAYVRATQTLELVWNFSDIANALMAIPNLICMLLLSGEIAKDVKEFQKTIEEEKAGK